MNPGSGSWRCLMRGRGGRLDVTWAVVSRYLRVRGRGDL